MTSSLEVSEIQEAISRLVVASEKGAGGIEEGMRESASTAERLSALEEAARQTTNSAQQISLSTQQQRTASDQVVVALREIVSASGNTASSIQRISQVSKEMTGLSAELGEMVARFKLKPAAEPMVERAQQAAVSPPPAAAAAPLDLPAAEAELPRD